MNCKASWWLSVWLLCCNPLHSLVITASATNLPVTVIILRLPDGTGDSGAPYVNKNTGTLPLNASGNVNLGQNHTLATDLTQEDVTEIFQEVNAFYAPANVHWVPTVKFVSPTVPCFGKTQVCGRYKCRTHDYFVKYFGTINKRISKDGREERSANIASLVPQEAFTPGHFHVLFLKYLGIASQGVVVGTDEFFRDDGKRVMIANVGQWSNKFTRDPIRRPNVVRNGMSYKDPSTSKRINNCGIGLAYSVAHGLGHLLGLGHTDAPSVISGCGRSGNATVFSKTQVRSIQGKVDEHGIATKPSSIHPLWGSVMFGSPQVPTALGDFQRTNHECVFPVAASALKKSSPPPSSSSSSSGGNSSWLWPVIAISVCIIIAAMITVTIFLMRRNANQGDVQPASFVRDREIPEMSRLSTNSSSPTTVLDEFNDIEPDLEDITTAIVSPAYKRTARRYRTPSTDELDLNPEPI